jgi:hypothetical protein
VLLPEKKTSENKQQKHPKTRRSTTIKHPEKSYSTPHIHLNPQHTEKPEIETAKQNHAHNAQNTTLHTKGKHTKRQKQKTSQYIEPYKTRALTSVKAEDSVGAGKPEDNDTGRP